MSAEAEKPLLVVSGPISPGLVFVLELTAFAVSTLSLAGLSILVKSKSLPDALERTWLPALIVGQDSLVLTYGILALGIVSAAIVGGFASRRTGEVAVLPRGVVWARKSASALAVEWALLEGFRDTPHPWVEIVRKNGQVRTIPIATEAERLRLLEVLATKLPDLSLPFEERRPPQ